MTFEGLFETPIFSETQPGGNLQANQERIKGPPDRH